MNIKTIALHTLFAGFLALCSVSAYGLSDEDLARLKTLRGLSLGDLQEVEIRLDDAFDVFSGIVRRQNVSVATGVAQSQDHAPSATSVITAQDIEAMGADTLDEVLAAVPGLHSTLVSNGKSYTTLYLIRSLGVGSGAEVLILFNGISINTLQQGFRPSWRGMPVQAIARIEVIRGTGSAVYGADAYSGVINIITKTREDINGTEAGVRTGSFDTRNAWLVHGGTWAGFDVAASLQYKTSDGHKEIIREDIQTAFDQAFNTDISLAPGPANVSRDTLDLHVDLARGYWRGRALYQSNSHVGTGAGLGGALDPEGFWATKLTLTDLTYHNPSVGRDWDVSATLSYYYWSWKPESNVRLYPRGAFGGAFPDGFIGNPGYSERNGRLDIAGVYRGFAKHQFRIGAGYHHADLYEVVESKNFSLGPDGQPLDSTAPPVSVTGTPYSWLPEGTRQNKYLSLQDVWQFAPDWELTAGVRYDDYSDFGSTVNPRGALVWQMSPALTAKLMYGRAFRAPSYAEKFARNNPVYVGNTNLQPELIESLELGFDYRARENLHLALGFFGYDAKDKILYAPNLSGENEEAATGGRAPMLPRNIGKQKGYGLEFESRWKINTRSSLLFNYSYTKATDELERNIAKTPQHMAYARADWLLFPNWYLDAQAKWISKRYREAGDPRSALDGYTTVNLTVRYKDIRKGGWNFALGVRNLFDAEVFEPSDGPDRDGVISTPYDLPLAGRNWWVEVRYIFK